MTMHLTSGIARRATTFAAAGFVALGSAAVLAPAANADDYERTPAEVIELLEAQVWPNYNLENPGPSPDIRFAQYFLDEVGHPIANPGEEYDEEMDELIAEFDSEYGLNEDRTLESQTWIKIRNLNFPGEFDSYSLGDEGEAVKGIQYILNEKFEAELEVDGDYDQDTADAVSAAQEECGIGVDSAFGRLTYKCAVTKPHEEASEDADAAEQVPAEEAPVEEAPAEQAPAEDAETTGDAPAEEAPAEDAERAEELDGARGYHY